jgi:Family of unknown function (DUF5691)
MDTEHGVSTPWSPLLPLALVGTDRHAGTLPRWPGEIGELIAAAAETAPHPATGALRAAAVLASCGLAGDLGQPGAAEPPPAAPHDRLPALQGAPQVERAAWALREGPTRLQHALLATLAALGCRLPPPLLPAALELSRRSLALRPAVAAVLGERGRWLAAQRDDWRHAAGAADEGDAEAAWDQGSLDQRRALLMRQRQQDPAAARERLAATLTELPARERADLASVLAEGLGLDDEPLLDTLRRDRSREVRQVALALLLRLPEAAHPRRAGERLAGLMSHERALLRKRWVIDAPAAAGGDWTDDQVEVDRPKQESLGERAWWLLQLVRQVPLAWWTHHTGLSPAELLAWARGGDWAEALQRGWHEVLLAAPDSGWAEALLDAWPDALKRHDPAAVLVLLPPPARERRWLQQLRAGGAAALDALLPQVLAGSPPPQTLSPDLSGALLDAVAQRLQAGQVMHDWVLRSHLAELACAVHRDALPRLQALPRNADETPALAELMHTVAQVAATRGALAAMASSSPLLLQGRPT